MWASRIQHPGFFYGDNECKWEALRLWGATSQCRNSTDFCRLRARASEVLAKAETMKDADARQKMQEIAAGYERLARRLEEASGGKES
jgi:hypothetical protein